MTSTPPPNALTLQVDLGELVQTLHGIRSDRRFFEVFDALASELTAVDVALWLQIDGEGLATEAPAAIPRDSRSPGGGRWSGHDGWGPQLGTGAITLHASTRQHPGPADEMPSAVGLSFKDATLTLSHLGGTMHSDRFFAHLNGALTPLKERHPIKVNGRVIGAVSRNDSGLCQLRFNAFCGMESLQEVLSHMVFFGSRLKQPSCVIDWSFSCFYLGRRQTADEQVFMGSTDCHTVIPLVRSAPEMQALS